MRLDRFLADAGVGSRSEVKALVKKGRVRIGELHVKDSSVSIDPDTDEVFVDDTQVRLRNENIYIVLNKPQGVITANDDPMHKTVFDLLPPNMRKGISAVGRLDKDTEGLLLLTDDGKLNHRLMAPKSHISKTYYVEVDGLVDDSVVELFASGMDIGDDKPLKSARLEVLYSSESHSEAYITITEGRYHQIKRMFRKCDMTVTFLKRVSLGAFELPKELAPGEWREMSKEELAMLNQ